MDQLLRLISGQWTKSLDGIWRFEGDPSIEEHYIITKTNEKIPALMSLVRNELGIEEDTPMVLSYHLPPNLLLPYGSTSQPTNVLTPEDVEILLSIQEWTKNVVLYVTFGAANVAKYNFLCREPFTIGDTTFLSDGISEEDHVAAIIDMVGEDEFHFSGPGPDEIFNQRNLVVVYRFSLEIENARAMIGRNNSRTNNFTQMLGHEGGEGDKTTQHNERDERLHFEDGDNRDTDVDVEDWNDFINLVEVGESSTGSTQSSFMNAQFPILNDVYNANRVGNDRGIFERCSRGDPTERAGMDNIFSREAESVVIGGNHNNSSNIDLTMEEDYFQMGDPNGNMIHNPDDLFVGMIFKNREDFKQHIAMYAIRNKCLFRNTRSSPSEMILRCFCTTCKWRVYAVILKNTKMFEVRTVYLQHSCTVDDRCGYQSQATHTVIGGMMKARFAGRRGGPRPNDIMQTMEGDHDVHISYWKAWRSRKVALEYAKGSSGASYNLLPSYLNKLVCSNPGTIIDVYTEYAEGIGHRFKYMFMALSARIEGYKYMRNVIIVDGTHLWGKYAGCLLSASAQDGNYQVFPLDIAVVDGENDKAWEWFFQKLTLFIPDSSEVVFVSDRHPSIYHGIGKVYPNGCHCACILHLKRNMRTYFKDKHLGYLVGKICTCV
ncbi:hypothetical protein Bca101_058045 [Brassica carinata]